MCVPGIAIEKLFTPINNTTSGETTIEVRNMFRFNRIPINLTMILGLFLLLIFVHIIKVILSLTISQWIFIGYVLLGVYLLRRYINRRKAIKELEERKIYLNRQRNLNDLKQMDWFDFESFICDIFILLGYDAYTTNRTNDGGKDIIIHKGDFYGIAECKRYDKSKITRPDIQKFHSAIIDSNAEKGYFITTGEFTKPAIQYVLDKPIVLINGEKIVMLLEKIRNSDVEAVHSIETLIEI